MRIADDAVTSPSDFKYLQERLFGRRVAAILTNPPYSVGGKQAQHLPPQERGRLRQRQKALRMAINQRTGEPDIARVIRTDSIRPFFTVMMKDMLQGGGILAKVCPLTALTSVSGAGERDFFLKHFDVLQVITCHRKDFNFSVDTDVHEALLVMRRRKDGDGVPADTRFVALARRPRDGNEARQFARWIVDGGGDPAGTLQHRTRDFLAKGRWTPVFYENPELADHADWLEDLVEHHPDLVPLGDQYRANATGRTLRGRNWGFCERDDARSAIDVLKSASNQAQTMLQGQPDAGAYVRSDAPHTAQALMEARAGYLHMSSRHDTSSGRVLSVATDRLCVGSAFIPVSDTSRYEATRISVWMNSIVGRILMRHRHSKKLTYQWHEPAALATIRVPAPLPASNSLLLKWRRRQDPLHRAWVSTNDQEVPIYREGRAPIHDVWDRAVAQVLSVPVERLTEIRRLLDKEPSVGPTAGP